MGQLMPAAQLTRGPFVHHQPGFVDDHNLDLSVAVQVHHLAEIASVPGKGPLERPGLSNLPENLTRPIRKGQTKKLLVFHAGFVPLYVGEPGIERLVGMRTRALYEQNFVLPIAVEVPDGESRTPPRAHVPDRDGIDNIHSVFSSG